MKIKRPNAMFGPLFNAEGDTGGGGSPPAKPEPPKAKDDKPAGDEGGDKPLGPNGEKALEAERTARKELEKQLQQMRDGLSQAFGGKPDPKASTEDVIAALTKTVTDLQHSNLVNDTARSHGITEKDDLALLADAKTPEAMERLAVRLAAKAADDGKPGTPKPDLTQGGQGTDVPTQHKPGADRLRAGITAALEAKS